MLLLFLLILVSFLQATFGVVDWVMIVLVIRSFAENRKENYFLAFGFGLLLSFLQGYPIGSLSLIYLALIFATQMVKTMSYASNWLTVLPWVTIVLLASSFLEKLLFNYQFSYQQMILPAVLTLPIYILIRFWEERFTPQKGIRLKMSD